MQPRNNHRFYATPLIRHYRTCCSRGLLLLRRSFLPACGFTHRMTASGSSACRRVRPAGLCVAALGKDLNTSARYTRRAVPLQTCSSLAVFLLVGFLDDQPISPRAQIVAASAIARTSAITAEGEVVQDPRKVPEQLRVRRGAIAGDKVIAASQVISPSRFVHRVYPEPNISYLPVTTITLTTGRPA